MVCVRFGGMQGWMNMGKPLCAKDLRVVRVLRANAVEAIRKWHYSGREYVKSSVHYGVILDDVMIGALQFGDPLDVHKAAHLFDGAGRDEFIELNRMALSPAAPRNAASRVLSVSLGILRSERPALQWVLSYSDATQCGDGACYRGAGFLLSQCRKNTTLLRAPDGAIVSDVGVRTSRRLQALYGTDGTAKSLRDAGMVPLGGYQLRYIWCYSRSARKRLLAPVISYGDIPVAARMYKGIACAGVAGPVLPAREGVRLDPHAPQNHVPHQLALW